MASRRKSEASKEASEAGNTFWTIDRRPCYHSAMVSENRKDWLRASATGVRVGEWSGVLHPAEQGAVENRVSGVEWRRRKSRADAEENDTSTYIDVKSLDFFAGDPELTIADEGEDGAAGFDELVHPSGELGKIKTAQGEFGCVPTFAKRGRMWATRVR